MKSTTIPDQAFTDWLERAHGMRPRSAQDVVSRLKRASEYIDPVSQVPDDALIKRLTSAPEFNRLSIFVRSQLKRAVTLYRQYLATRRCRHQ